MLCWFWLFSKVNQSESTPLFFRFFCHIHYRVLSRVPCAIQWVLIYFIHSSRHMSILISQFIPPPSSLFSGNHKLISYISDSGAVFLVIPSPFGVWGWLLATHEPWAPRSGRHIPPKQRPPSVPGQPAPVGLAHLPPSGPAFPLDNDPQMAFSVSWSSSAQAPSTSWRCKTCMATDPQEILMCGEAACPLCKSPWPGRGGMPGFCLSPLWLPREPLPRLQAEIHSDCAWWPDQTPQAVWGLNSDEAGPASSSSVSRSLQLTGPFEGPTHCFPTPPPPYPLLPHPLAQASLSSLEVDFFSAFYLSFLFFKLVKYDNKFTRDLENTKQNYK